MANNGVLLCLVLLNSCAPLASYRNRTIRIALKLRPLVVLTGSSGDRNLQYTQFPQAVEGDMSKRGKKQNFDTETK